MPATAKFDRAAIQSGQAVDFPLIIRPVDSHAGDGLEKIDCAAGLRAYLDSHTEAEFYVSLFRIIGAPTACSASTGLWSLTEWHFPPYGHLRPLDDPLRQRRNGGKAQKSGRKKRQFSDGFLTGVRAASSPGDCRDGRSAGPGLLRAGLRGDAGRTLADLRGRHGPCRSRAWTRQDIFPYKAAPCRQSSPRSKLCYRRQ